MVHHWPSEIILKWHFLEKKMTNIISTENCATFISGNQYDRLSQQSFFVAVVSLSNSSREKYINTTERQAQGVSAVCNKNFSQVSAQVLQIIKIAFIALLEMPTSMDHLKKQSSSEDDNLIFCTIKNEIKTGQKTQFQE